MTAITDGNLPTSSGAIYTAGPTSASPAYGSYKLTLRNTSGSTQQTIALTVTRANTGNSRSLPQVILAANQSAVLDGLTLSPGDVLAGSTTTASTANYMLDGVGGEHPFTLTLYDANGAAMTNPNG